MEITINKTGGDMLQQNKIRWQLYERKKILFNLLYIAFGFFLILFSLFDSGKETSFWNFTTSVGMSFIFLAIIYLSHLFQIKKKFFARVQLLVDRWKANNNTATITINESGIIYRDLETISESKWTSFNNYKIYKDYLIIDDYGEVLGAVMINIKALNADEQATLKKFLENLFRPT